MVQRHSLSLEHGTRDPDSEFDITQPIFQDNNGFAIKFFIQKDLAQEIQAELCETITSLGGRVEGKVPRQGYILVQPGTPEEERLRLCWTSADRPERYFVPYTYVDACKIAGMLLKQIFVHEGEPIKMYIHPSIANINARTALSQRIMHSGGDPHASAQSARVILADPNTDIFQHLVKVYQAVSDKYIESYLWVKKCVEKGALVYTPVVYKNPGGRRPGEERTQFTEEDEQHLCNWIAAKIPYKETGGRTGNRLYQQLCDLAADPEYIWVSRHTWQSWRERYKKNAARLDATIATIVEQKKPAQGEKGQYGYVRKAEEKPKRSRKKRGRHTEHAPSDEDLIGALDERGEVMPGMIGVSALQNVSGMHMHVPVMQGMQGMSLYGSMDHMSAPVGGPLDHSAARNSPAEEEMDDMEEGSEWAVKVGSDGPPEWAKRKAREEEVEEENPMKRQKTLEFIAGPTQNGSQSLPQNELTELNAQELHALAHLHVIDQGIRDIAREFRFTVEEVQEYYDRCGEMGRTRIRFQRMRQELRSRFMDDDLR